MSDGPSAPSASPASSSTTDDQPKPSATAQPKPSESSPIICPGHSRPVPDIAFTSVTADGYFLISACLDNKAMLRDGSTGDWIGTFIGHKGAVWCARLDAKAVKAVTGAADFSAKVWDALTGDELLSLPHRHIVKSVTFDSGGERVMTGGQEKKVRVWDLAAVDQPLLTMEGHTQSVAQCISLANEPQLVLTAAGEPDVRVWDMRTGTCVSRISTNGAAVRGAQLSIDGTTLTVCTATKQVLFFAATTAAFTPQHSLTLPVQTDCVSYSPSTRLLVTGAESELWARVWRYEGGEEVGVYKGHHGPVRAVCFAPDGQAFASGSEDGTIRIWQQPGGAGK